jgi:hypothetical protein
MLINCTYIPITHFQPFSAFLCFHVSVNCHSRWMNPMFAILIVYFLRFHSWVPRSRHCPVVVEIPGTVTLFQPNLFCSPRSPLLHRLLAMAEADGRRMESVFVSRLHQENSRLLTSSINGSPAVSPPPCSARRLHFPSNKGARSSVSPSGAASQIETAPALTIVGPRPRHQ